MQPLTRNALIILGIVAAAFFVGHWDGHRAGVQDASADNYRIVSEARTDTIRVVEQRVRVDTVRVRIAEQKAVSARVSFDSAAARVEAVADTSKMVPASLVLPEIQLCKELRDAQLEQIDGLKVAVRDLDEDVSLQKRRADLAEAQLKKAKPRFGFRAGMIAGVSLAITVVHLIR